MLELRKSPLWLLSVPCLLLMSAGCGDDSSSANEVGNEASDTGTTNDTNTEVGTSSSTGDGDGDLTTGDGDGDPTTGDGDGDPTTGDGDGDPTTGDGDGDPTTGDGDGDPTTGDGDGDPTTGDGDGDPCQGMGPNTFDFSYIWIANSPEGTVSKIDTLSAVEVARYVSGPPNATDPSRTSVSGNGKFAVVANRNGGLTMISADEDGCVDTNNNGTIETSQGPNDVLPWGQDECVIWNISLPASSNQGPRPVSWTIGELNPLTCEYSVGDVWIGWYSQAINTGYFRLVEGMTGATIDEVQVPNWSGMSWGPYGGAIDSENNFWVVGWGDNGPVVKIDGQTHAPTHYGNPGGWLYGMGLDLEGNTWAGGCGAGNIYRFHKQTETWSQVATIPGVSCLRGLQVDIDGVAWVAKNGPCGIAAIDTQVEPPAIINANIPIAGCATPVGVSIDAEGYVWVVDQGGRAYKMDPDTYQIVAQVDGLVGPYTYSDMTGAGINAQINPQ